VRLGRVLRREGARRRVAAPLLVLGDAVVVRATVGWYSPTPDTLAEAAVNELRFHTVGGAEGRKVLIERQHTNLVWPSRDITPAQWTVGSGVTTTANAAAGPDGAVLADRSAVGSGGYSRYRQVTAGDGCGSWWVRRPPGAGSGVWQGSGGWPGALAGRRKTVGETWEPVDIISPTGTASKILVPVDGRTLAVQFGEALEAGAVDAITDFHQWEAGTRYPRSPVVTVSGSATCDPDNLTWPAGAWALSEVFTLDVWPLFASSELVSGNVRWLLSIGGANNGVRLRHDGTGVRIECVDAGSVVTVGPYLSFARHARLRVVVERSTSRLSVNGVSGGIFAALAWGPFEAPGVALRLGGISGAAVGSGEEADARFDLPTEGASSSPFVLTTCCLGDSITVGGDSTSSLGYKHRLSTLAGAAGVPYRNVGPYRTGPAFDVNHAGVNGNTIDDMRARVAVDVAAFRPRAVVVHAGTNSLGFGVSAMLASIAGLASDLRAALPSAFLVFCGIPPRVGYVADAASFNAQLGSAVSAVLASGTFAVVQPGVLESEIDGDGVHPLDPGHDKIAAAAWAALEARFA